MGIILLSADIEAEEAQKNEERKSGDKAGKH